MAIFGASSAASAGPPPRQEVDARIYQWRGEDQIAAIFDAATGPRFYDHDDRGRLIRERRPDAVVERAMDEVGNVFRTAEGRDRRYGPGGRLEVADGVQYEHDEDGNQTRKVEVDGSEWRYAWNGHGMLREVERPDGLRVQFEYDPFARRTAKRSVNADGVVQRERAFVWDGHVVVHELDAETGVTTWHWEQGSFAPIAKEHAGRRWSIAADHLGTPTEMYDDAGLLAWKMQLDVFGVPTFERGAPEDCPWRWPGQYEDGDTKESNNRFRHYHAGVFTSRDPIGLLGGIHPTAYVPDPLQLADPLGLDYRTWQIHSPGTDDIVQKGLHFYAPGNVELAVRPDHRGGITFTNAIPNDAANPRLGAAISEAAERFESNARFRADILAKAREGVSSVLEFARRHTDEGLAALANGRSRELRDIARNVERRGGC